MTSNPYEAPTGVPDVPSPSIQTSCTSGFTTTYTVTRSILLSSSSQYFFAIALGWRWLGCIVTLAYAALCQLLNFPTIAAFAFAYAAFMIVMYVKSFLTFRNLALTQVPLIANKEVTIEMGESGITMSSARGSISYSWSDMNRMTTSRDFIFFMRDKLPLMSVPKSVLSTEASTWLLARVGKSG